MLALWMADKENIQYELSDQISDLVYCMISADKQSVLDNNKLHNFIRAAMNILNKEWNKIDKWRVNKFLYIVRQIHKKSFQCIMYIKNKSKYA